jgi:hypothetical protein
MGADYPISARSTPFIFCHDAKPQLNPNKSTGKPDQPSAQALYAYALDTARSMPRGVLRNR